MPVGLVLEGASLALSAYGAYESYDSSKKAASVDTAAADYNARTDEAMAKQLDLDTQQNIRTERQNDSVYLSREAAGYASAGVLATSGSPLHAQIMNAGRMEQEIQQQYQNNQQKQQQYYAAGKVGRLEGQARADADRQSGTLALINGGANIAGKIFRGYESGTFSGIGGSKQTAPMLDPRNE